jgi:hypothetical protein
MTRQQSLRSANRAWRRLALASVALALAGAASGADNCEAIRTQIDAKLKASGVARYALTTVDTGAAVPGKVVGSCDLGRKKIVYVQAHGAASASAPRATTGRARQEPMLTECKDGTVSLGGDCKP